MRSTFSHSARCFLSVPYVIAPTVKAKENKAKANPALAGMNEKDCPGFVSTFGYIFQLQLPRPQSIAHLSLLSFLGFPSLQPPTRPRPTPSARVARSRAPPSRSAKRRAFSRQRADQERIRVALAASVARYACRVCVNVYAFARAMSLSLFVSPFNRNHKRIQ